MSRLDLAYSLSSGRKPYFLHPSVSWEPFSNELLVDSGLYVPPSDWHQALRIVFLDFQRLAYAINLNTRKNKRYEAACFQNILSHLQSRLMHLETICVTPFEKLIRLSMLGLLAASFKVPGRRIPYTWLHKAFESEYASVTVTMELIDNGLQVWILLIAAILAAPERKPWIEKAWATVGDEANWRQVQNGLIKVIWIEDIHGRAGRVAFEQHSARYRN